jgi:hypothetical protein
MNNLRDDQCSMDQRNNANNKKLKYVTTNFNDLLTAKDQYNFFGMTTKDKLFVPSEKVDDYSSLVGGKTGTILTQLNVRTGLGQLPIPTTPGKYQLSHGDVVKEDQIRLSYQDNKKSSLPSDPQFYDRSFYVFNDSLGIESVKPENFVEAKNRAGISTRYPPTKK